MIRATARRANRVVHDWLVVPEKRAAGRLGLFRIGYSIFYLWNLSFHFAAPLDDVLAVSRRSHLLLDRIGTWWQSWLLPAEAILVGSLVLLLLGFTTRTMTGIVLVLGSAYEGIFTLVDAEQATVFLTFYIPLFMWIAGGWGDTYSLDALLARRAGPVIVEGCEDGPTYSVPIRAVLVMLCALFLSAGVFKIQGGFWLSGPQHLGNSLLGGIAKEALSGGPANPLGPMLVDGTGVLVTPAYAVLVFELLFVLALLGGRIRDLILALALIFHATCAIWFGVTFTPVLVVYGLFIDWPAIAGRIGLGYDALSLRRLGTRPVIAGAVGLALAISLAWNLDGGLVRSAANLGGAIDGRRIWYPVLPLALFWCMRSCVRLAHAVRRPRAHRLSSAARERDAGIALEPPRS
jgi:hypothetical protein